MTAAEDVHAARMAQRLNIHAVFPNGLGGKIARSVLWDLSVRDNVKLAYAVAVEREQQPEVNVPVEQATPAAQHRDILCLFGRKS